MNTGYLDLGLEKVSFVNQLGPLQKATSDDDKAIPGYLYEEICGISLESDVFCECTVEYLVERLKKDSPNVKLKVLKLMKYLVDRSSRNFQLGLIKNSAGITTSKKYNGPPDPLHGNVPYLAVRKEAEILSETLFDTEKESCTSKTEEVKLSGSGYGSSNSSKSKYQGFGNAPVETKKTLGESILSSVNKLAERLVEPEDDPRRDLLASISNVGAYEPPKGYIKSSGISAREYQLSIPTREETKPHIPGKAGGGWDDEDDDLNESSTDQQSSLCGDVSDRLENAVIEDWASEHNLIVNTVDQGEDFLLTRTQIKSFIRTCSELNCDKILELLQIRLLSPDSNIVMRSLLLVEHLLYTDLVTPEKVSSECSQNLQHLLTSEEGPNLSKAKKILKILEKLVEDGQAENAVFQTS